MSAEDFRVLVAKAISRGVDGMSAEDFDSASVDYQNEMLDGADAVMALYTAQQDTSADVSSPQAQAHNLSILNRNGYLR